MHRLGLPGGATVGIGSLPHRDADAAARFALTATDLVTIPTLPRRSPAEDLVVQTMVGIRGVTTGQYGAVAIDLTQIDPDAESDTSIIHDAFGGLRAFLDVVAASRLPSPLGVKWQCVGPITLGVALMRGGVSEAVAFDVATAAVRARIQALAAHIRRVMPTTVQVVFVDEPCFADIMADDFVLPPDVAIDMVSAALSAAEPHAVAGLHVCAPAPFDALAAVGPSVISVPAAHVPVEAAPFVQRYLANGGRIAWGVVPTGGPVPTSADRPWRRLSARWCELVQHGVDPVLLRTHSLVSPECGLGSHTATVAERVFRLTTDVGQRVRDQASASRWVLGA